MREFIQGVRIPDIPCGGQAAGAPCPGPAASGPGPVASGQGIMTGPGRGHDRPWPGIYQWPGPPDRAGHPGLGSTWTNLQVPASQRLLRLGLAGRAS